MNAVKTSPVHPLRSMIREPLVHFLLLGLVLFYVYALVSKDEAADSDHILVTRDQLLTFMQYRAKAFDRQGFSERLNTLPKQQLKQLVDDYVREEALYREAKALQLDRHDYTARRRLIRRLETISGSLMNADQTVSAQALTSYFEAHKENYLVPEKITFTHVFISHAQHGLDKARRLAQQTLKDLNEQKVPFHLAMSRGDRFLYHTNYVNKEADLIGSHFGQAMQDEIFLLEQDEQTWQGPLQSSYGFHLVMVTNKVLAYQPPLEEVQTQVMRDVGQNRSRENLEKFVQELISQYQVELVDLPLVSGA